MTSGRSGRDTGAHRPDEILTLSKAASIMEGSYFYTGEWREAAACLDVDIDFFPDVGGKDIAREAKVYCRVCPVRLECLTYALATKQPGGIWGGKTIQERNKILRKIRRAGFQIG